MSGLENLTAKIIRDANEQAERIAADAKAQAKQIVDAAEAEAEREKERILAEADVQAAHTAEQIVLGKTLEIRDNNLDAKQQILEKIFSQALDRLNSMSKDEYWKFLTGYLSGMDTDGEEIILPKKYGIASVEELNEVLKKNGKKGNLVLSADGREIDGGFVLSKNGIEQNNTFEALISKTRYDQESEILRMLY